MPRTAKSAEAAAVSGDRKRKNASETPRQVMAFRVNKELYDKLQASSQQRQLSLSEEIEKRLEHSFQTASDPRKDIALRLIADNWRAIEEIMEANMFEDDQVNLACGQTAKTTVTTLGGLLIGSSPTSELARELIRPDAEAFGMAAALMMVHVKGKIDDPETRQKLKAIMVEIQTRRLEGNNARISPYAKRETLNYQE